MEVIIPSVVILFFLGVIYVRLANQRKLLKEIESYEIMLRNARVIRLQYIQALEGSRDALKELQHIEESLKSIKAELYSFREELREMLLTLRKEIEKSTETLLDKRTISQMRTNFEQKWKVADGRKHFYRQVLATCRQTRPILHQKAKEEDQANERWAVEKEKVMVFYRNLSPKAKITDPLKYLT